MADSSGWSGFALAPQEPQEELQLKHKALVWLEEILPEDLREAEFHATLQSGQRLCQVLNTFWPKKFSLVALERHEQVDYIANLEQYLSACRSLGLQDSDCFSPQAFVQGEDQGGAARNILAVKNLILREVPQRNLRKLLVHLQVIHHLPDQKGVCNSMVVESTSARAPANSVGSAPPGAGRDDLREEPPCSAAGSESCQLGVDRRAGKMSTRVEPGMRAKWKRKRPPAPTKRSLVVPIGSSAQNTVTVLPSPLVAERDTGDEGNVSHSGQSFSSFEEVSSMPDLADWTYIS
mmetsp:Transcript_7518/g.13091  ORF Transcript_7518/g.13091 Transcript_7518/m.13091 type:complete len:292 (-) Transcript_7518:699-1574(-)